MIFPQRDRAKYGLFPHWEDDSMLVHAFSTRKGGVSQGDVSSLNLGLNRDDSPENVEENRSRFLRDIGVPEGCIVQANQIHSARVEKVDSPGVIENCDGLITDTPELYPVIGVADCHAVFLASTNRSAVGILHAGWRGIAGGIIEEGISKLAEECGIPVREIELGIGPGIGECCYEVGTEVASRFPHATISQRDEGLFLNLREAIRLRAERNGILPDRITVSDHCTSCEEETWFSYRRDDGKTGRMWGIIGIRSKRKKSDDR